MTTDSQIAWEANPSEPLVVLTEKAAQVFIESCQEGGKSFEDSFLRVGANRGGCSGYRYELDWNDSNDIKDTDVRLASQGVNIVVDQHCLKDILGSVEIDYTDANMVEQGFVFKQLKSGHQCGCGESFTAVKDLR